MKPIRLSLKAKLSVAFIAVTVCGALVAGLLVDRNVRRTTESAFEDRLSYETTMLGQMVAGALFGEIDPGDTSLEESVRALGQSVHTRLAVIAKDGTVVADSDAADPRAEGSQADAAEVQAARAHGTGSAVRAGRMFVAKAIVRDGGVLGFARSSVPTSEVTAYVRAVRARMAIGSAIALAIAAALGLLFSSRLVRPIRALSAGARLVGAGDYGHRIAVATRDELGELAASFNDMTGSLRATMDKLDGRNRDMRRVLDNVSEGLVTIDRSGVMSNERSAVLDRWFGPPEQGQTFVDYLARAAPETAEAFQLQWEELLEGAMPLRLLIDQMPSRLACGDKLFEMSYTPIVEADDPRRIAMLLIVVRDVTARVAAERAEADQREAACIFERIARDKAGVLDFVLAAGSQVAALTGAERPTLADTKRTLHTLKGNSAIYGMQRLSMLCHDIESRMEESEGDISADDARALAETWTRTAHRLSTFLGDGERGISIDDDEYAALLRAVLDGCPRAVVARMVADWKMERASDRLERYASQARELARRLHKGAVEVTVETTALRLPGEEWAPFWTAFTHVVRNAVDHGLETEEERSRSGKAVPARIALAASRVDETVVLEISDDGHGIAWDRIADRARAAGLPTGSPQDLVDALFADGVSSKTAVTDVSGRGVGMGAVKSACERLGATIEVESRPGQGTTFRFRFRMPERSGLNPRPAPESTLPRAAKRA